MKWMLTLACALAGVGVGLGIGVAVAPPGAPVRPAMVDDAPPPARPKAAAPQARGPVEAAQPEPAPPARPGVPVEIRMPDGALAEYAHVDVHDAETRRTVGAPVLWTPAAPELQIGPGAWLISARSGTYHEYRVFHQPLEVAPGVAPGVLLLQLELQVVIAGTVRLPPMMGQMSANVFLKRLDGEIASLSGARFEPGRQVTATEPSFGYLLASPGRYELRLRAGPSDAVTREVEASVGVTHVRLELPGPDASEYAVVRVHGPQGPVTRGVSMALYAYRGNRRTGGSTVPTLSDGAGEYWVPRSAFRQAEVARFALTVQSPYGQKEVPIDPESTAPVDVYFEPAAWLQVVINRPEGGPEIPVKLIHWKAGEPPGGLDFLRFDWHHVDADRMRIGPLVPGDYEVALHHMLSSPYNPIELDLAAVTAVAGETVVSLTVPKLYELKVVIPPEYQTYRLKFVSHANARSSLGVYVQRRPELSIAPLRAGTYELSLENVGAMLVRVPHPEGRVTLDPQPFNALRVLVFGPGGGKDIGLRHGDLVLNIDGAPPFNERGQAVNDWRTREQTTWDILREGANVRVRFTAADWDNAGLQTEGARVE